MFVGSANRGLTTMLLMLSTMTGRTQAHILVVDDEQMLLDMVSDALSFAGYDIVVATDGLDSPQHVRTNGPTW